MLLPSRLVNDGKRTKLQLPHVDVENLYECMRCKREHRHLVILFPITTEGAWLQVWPEGNGYGNIVRLELGEVLFFEPNIVHAGGLGESCPRVQAYLVKTDSGITYQKQATEHVHKDLNRPYADFCLSCVEKE